VQGVAGDQLLNVVDVNFGLWNEISNSE